MAIILKIHLRYLSILTDSQTWFHETNICWSHIGLFLVDLVDFQCEKTNIISERENPRQGSIAIRKFVSNQGILCVM